MIISRFQGAARMLFSAALLCALNACTTPAAKENLSSAAETSTVPRVAGTIARVNSDFDFVLVRCNLPPLPESLAEIYRDGERIGLIEFKARSTHPYYAADVLSGTLRKGDIAAYRD